MKIKGHLGVCQLYGDEKNYSIVLLHHERHGEQITKSRVTFLIMCWKDRQRGRARALKDRYLAFLGMTATQQQEELARAKAEIEKGFVQLNVKIP